MKVFFRVDANKNIGSGHLTRCAGLSLVLKNHGIECSFVVDKNNFFEYPHIPKLTFEFISPNSLYEDAFQTLAIISNYPLESSLVLDSYLHDFEWENIVAPRVKKLLVWDDLANRKHSCSILLDCGLQRSTIDYKELVSTETEMLIGPKYCPISIDIKNIRQNEFENNKIHLFFGSVDSGEIALNYYREIIKALPQYEINVALANKSSDKWKSEIRPQDRIFIGRPLSESLGECTYAIGAPGTTTWERIFLGIYSFYFSTNKNQIEILNKLSEIGVCHYLGEISTTPIKNIQTIATLIQNIDLKNFRKISKNMIDGLGLERIAKEILK